MQYTYQMHCGIVCLLVAAVLRLGIRQLEAGLLQRGPHLAHFVVDGHSASIQHLMAFTAGVPSEISFTMGEQQKEATTKSEKHWENGEANVVGHFCLGVCVLELLNILKISIKLLVFFFIFKSFSAFAA
jgi:hypothetical protein